METLLAGSPLRPLIPALKKWFLRDLEKLSAYAPLEPRQFFPDFLESLNIIHDCPEADLHRIPAKGAAIIVSNHPFGLADGLILGALVSAVRSDFRFLANSFLDGISQLQDFVIPVNPFGGPDSVRANFRAVRRALDWLHSGRLLIAFPAGEVSTWQWPPLGIRDREWTENIARISVRTGAPAVPVYFHGVNSPLFHTAGLIHPRLRTMLLPHELLNKAGSTIRVSIGSPVRAQRLAQMGATRAATEFLRARTYLLEGRPEHRPAAGAFWPLSLHRNSIPLVPAQDPAAMAREIAALPPANRLLESSDCDVFVASATAIPAVLAEIGRLREFTFRCVSEGTGRASDLDGFDPHYEHLFVWNRDKQEVVGAYRIARTDDVLGRHGQGGLYTGTLFHLRAGFYANVGPALELGRSFVRPEYQKSYQPLLLLWKGLGHYVAAHPRYRVLFGPVSISKDYSPTSRALIISYLKKQHNDNDLAAYVRPRRKFRSRALTELDPRNFASLASNLEDLSEMISHLEADRKGIPILLQQYLNLGGKVLEFSLDRAFSNVLDGLIVVDLARAGSRQLDRYMGKENARNFLTFHQTLQKRFLP